MKKMKKLLAVTLMVAMVCGMFAVVEPEKAEAAMPTTEYFNETFSTDGEFDNSTWKTSKNANDEDNMTLWNSCVSNGMFTVPGTNSEKLYLMVDDSDMLNLSDYNAIINIYI